MKGQETVFHKIIRREIPANIIYENDNLIAFSDVNPVAPTHILIVPKKDIRDVDSVDEQDQLLLGEMVVVASHIARESGISEDGYRIVINCGEHGNQTVFQLHMHLIGGRQFSWPPG